MTRKTFRNQITSPELWEQVNADTKKLVARFLKEKSMRSSDGTVAGYESDLHIFLIWNLLENDNKHFTEIRKIEFSDFFSYAIENLKWGSSRFSRMKSVLSSFSNFIEKYFDESYKDFRNQILKSVESLPKNAVREKTILSEEQVNYIFSKLKENNEIQIACWFALAIASGSRFAELLRFTVDNIDENNLVFGDIFIETNRAIRTKGRGRAGKLLKKYIVKDMFLPYYKVWLEERAKILKKNNKEHDFIFIKENGDPATEYVARYWVSKIEEYLGGIPFYPHATRHFLVTYLSRIGLHGDLIIELMGWTAADMLKIYCDLSAKDREWKELDRLKEALANK